MKKVIVITAAASSLLCSCAGVVSHSLPRPDPTYAVPTYTVSDETRALEPIKTQMGSQDQIQGRARVIATVLHGVKNVIEQTPVSKKFSSQNRVQAAAAINDFESGMTAIATAQDQNSFDSALIGMCTTSRLNTAQILGPGLAQLSAQYLAKHPELTDQNSESENVTNVKLVGAVGDAIANVPNFCTQYATRLQNVQIANAQARQMEEQQQQAYYAAQAQNQADNNQLLMQLVAGYFGYIGTPRYQGVGGALNNAYNAARSVQ